MKAYNRVTDLQDEQADNVEMSRLSETLKSIHGKVTEQEVNLTPVLETMEYHLERLLQLNETIQTTVWKMPVDNVTLNNPSKLLKSISYKCSLRKASMMSPAT